MQAGAYNKASRTLIEIGVPRECALFLNDNLFNDFDNKDKNDTEIEEKIRITLNHNKDELPYWVKVQLNFLG